MGSPGLILSLWGRDAQYDRKGQRPTFGAVGVGAPTYLAAVKAVFQGQAGAEPAASPDSGGIPAL